MAVYVVFTAIAFGSLSNHHYELDDLAYLIDLGQMRQDITTILASNRNLPGRPLTDLVLLLLNVTLGSEPAVFHIAIVICHLIATILLTLTYHKLGLNTELSILSGFLFLINLAHFRAIQWISCLAYPLALSVGCLGILAYLFYQKTADKKWYILSILFFLLGLLSHPATIAFPIFMAYFTYHQKQKLRPIVILIVIAITFLFLLLKQFPNVPQAEHATAALQWEITDFIRHGFWYLGRLWTSTFFVFPNMNEIYTFDLIGGLLAVLGVATLIYYRVFPIAYWGIWMLLGLAVFVTNPNQTHFESGPSRHLYFASAGSVVILAYVCQQISFKVAQQIKNNWLPKLCLLLLVSTITGLSLFGLKKAEAFAFALSARTLLVYEHKEQATQYFEKAVNRAPQFVTSAMYERFLIANLAEGKFLTNSLHQALAHYPNNGLIVAIRMFYGFQSDTVDHQHLTDRIVTFAKQLSEEKQKFAAIACLNLGYYYTAQAQDQSAEILFQGALKIKPDYPEATIHLSRNFTKQNKIQAAQKLLSTAVQYQPNHVELLKSLADIYVLQKNWTQATDLYKRIIALQPNATEERFILGYIYLTQKKYSEAKPHFEHLTQLAPDNWQNFAYLGQCLHAEGNFEAAKRAYQKALQINPDQPELQTLLRNLTQNN